MTDLPFRSAKQLAALIRQKKVGCLELLETYIARVEPVQSASERHRRVGPRGRRVVARERPTGSRSQARSGGRCTACR